MRASVTMECQLRKKQQNHWEILHRVLSVDWWILEVERKNPGIWAVGFLCTAAVF